MGRLDENVDEMMQTISKEMIRLKYTCFGKVTNTNKFEKEQKKIEKLQKEKEELSSSNKNQGDVAKKSEVDEKLGKALSTLNKRIFEDELTSLKRTKEEKGKSAAVYNLQQRILGKKNSPLDAIAVEDPSSGIIVDEPERIKEISLKYCADLLQNREPAQDMKK